MTEVSVLMPAYNVAPYVEQAVRSVLRQTLADLELLVVDDGSSDGTPVLVERVASEDNRVRLLRHARNLGPAAARNTGLAEARGRWIALVDSDDWIAPGRLERLVRLGEAQPADWIADDCWIEPEAGGGPRRRLLAGEPPGCHAVPAAHLVRMDPPERMGYGLLKPMIRRSFLETHGIRYRSAFDRVEDFVLTVDCAAAGARFFLLNEPLYHYRLRQGSITRMAPLPSLEISLAAHRFAAERLGGTADAALAQALRLRGVLIERAIRYRRIVEPLKDGRPLPVLLGLARDPAILPRVVAGMAAGFVRRSLLALAAPRRSPCRHLRGRDTPDGNGSEHHPPAPPRPMAPFAPSQDH